MRCSLDKVLLDARQLANRIRATDETADVLIKQASDAHSKIIAKKQCQEEILSFEELNQISKSRPRSRLMMCIAAENKQLELLRQENKVLRTSLNEYETTFEMIMKKFRKHKNILQTLDRLEKGDLTSSFVPQSETNSESDNQILCLCSKIADLQKAIEKALIVDNKVTDDLVEIETKLLFENQELRRLVDINEEFKNDLQQFVSDSKELRSQSSQKLFRVKNPLELLPHDNVSTSVMNGLPKEPKTKIVPSKTISRFPRVAVNNHSSETYNNNSSLADRCSTFSDDDDDHSSVASDASVKTLI